MEKLQSKILIISKTPTHRTTAGNRFLILSYSQLLSKLGCDVHFLFIYEQPLLYFSETRKEDLIETENYWKEKFHLYKVSRLQKLFINLRVYTHKLFLNYYTHCDDNYPVGLSKYVNRLQKEFLFDACIVNYYFLTKLFKTVKIPKKALFTHDNYTYKDLAIGTRADASINALQSAKAMQRSPFIFAVQDEEAIFFKLLSPLSKVFKIYANYPYYPTEYVGSKTILFFSGPNIFNLNGLKWFLQEVFPLIIREFPDVKMLIGGGICRELSDMDNNEHIKLMGYMPSPLDFYKLGDVAINPVYQGTGIKIKTFEAVSYGKVTITHPHSIRGIFHKDSSPIFSSDNPVDWVTYLKEVWGESGFINEIKAKDEKYMNDMNDFIIDQYRQFINA